jgi:hypothetical protein
MSAQNSSGEKPAVLPLVEASDPVTTGIRRRAVLQSLVGGLGAGLAMPALADAHPMQQHAKDHAKVTAAHTKAAAGTYKPEFLDQHQLETLQALAERIVPGSTEAKVAPFIDQLLAVDSQNSQKAFLGAMGAFEMMAITEHNKPWKSLTAEQQDALLTTASTAAPGAGGPGMPFGGPPGGQGGKLTIRDHFNNLREWISGGYYSSEIGMKELGWTGQLFFDKLPGCDHPDGHA